MDRAIDILTYNTHFEKFESEFISIFKERHALLKDPKTGKELSISVCNHVSNKIKINHLIYYFAYANGDMYMFKKYITDPHYIVVNLVDMTAIVYVKGYCNSDKNLSTGAICNIVNLPKEGRLWYSKSLPDFDIRIYGKVYWDSATKLFYYDGERVNIEHWTYVHHTTKLIDMIELNYRSDLKLHGLIEG